MADEARTDEPVRHCNPNEHDCIEVVFAFPALIAAFEQWLASRGLYLFPIPVDPDNLPAYGVGVAADHD